MRFICSGETASAFISAIAFASVKRILRLITIYAPPMRPLIPLVREKLVRYFIGNLNKLVMCIPRVKIPQIDCCHISTSIRFLGEREKSNGARRGSATGTVFHLRTSCPEAGPVPKKGNKNTRLYKIQSGILKNGIEIYKAVFVILKAAKKSCCPVVGWLHQAVMIP